MFSALGDSSALTQNDDDDDEDDRKTKENSSSYGISSTHEKGLILPFKPLSLVFDHVYYYVDVPAVSSIDIFFAVLCSTLVTHVEFCNFVKRK